MTDVPVTSPLVFLYYTWLQIAHTVPKPMPDGSYLAMLCRQHLVAQQPSDQSSSTKSANWLGPAWACCVAARAVAYNLPARNGWWDDAFEAPILSRRFSGLSQTSKFCPCIYVYVHYCKPVLHNPYVIASSTYSWSACIVCMHMCMYAYVEHVCMPIACGIWVYVYTYTACVYVYAVYVYIMCIRMYTTGM